MDEREKEAAKRPEPQRDKAHQGSKPRKLGDTNAVPEHDERHEKAGRREFGRDG
jgi:hypothetical protein